VIGVVALVGDLPSVRMKRTGLPRASTAMLIFVLRPPRERPIASSSLPLLGAGCMLVRPHNGGIDDQVFEVRIFHPAQRKVAARRPFFVHHRKRLNTLFQLPNSSGRLRHGAPARTNHKTASTNRRLSAPCRPLSPCLPGISGSIRCHCPSVSARGIKIALPSCDLESHSRVRGNTPSNVHTT
jgi:hypothetical protein